VGSKTRRREPDSRVTRDAYLNDAAAASELPSHSDPRHVLGHSVGRGDRLLSTCGGPQRSIPPVGEQWVEPRPEGERRASWPFGSGLDLSLLEMSGTDEELLDLGKFRVAASRPAHRPRGLGPSSQGPKGHDGTRTAPSGLAPPADRPLLQARKGRAAAAEPASQSGRLAAAPGRRSPPPTSFLSRSAPPLSRSLPCPAGVSAARAQPPPRAETSRILQAGRATAALAIILKFRLRRECTC
jgi:hypothetical protein